MTRNQIHTYRVAYRAAWEAARHYGLAITEERADEWARIAVRDVEQLQVRLSHNRATEAILNTLVPRVVADLSCNPKPWDTSTDHDDVVIV